jgi:hypothetical protein
VQASPIGRFCAAWQVRPKRAQVKPLQQPPDVAQLRPSQLIIDPMQEVALARQGSPVAQQ